LRFLDSLVSPQNTTPDEGLRPLIREYLASTNIPSFTSTGTPDEGEEALAGLQATGLLGHDDADSTGVEGSMVEEEGMSEVDELLMHMSLADDGQVGPAVKGTSVLVTGCRLTGCPAELSLRRHVAVLANTLRVSGQASTASSLEVPARGARSGIRVGRDGMVNRWIPGRWTRSGGLGDRGTGSSS
jgi:hypothetical protein